jgi:hypothetical protein
MLTEAGTGKQIPVKVTNVRRLGDFATWRAARAVGNHDLNTFAIRADPVGRRIGAGHDSLDFADLNAQACSLRSPRQEAGVRTDS